LGYNGDLSDEIQLTNRLKLQGKSLALKQAAITANRVPISNAEMMRITRLYITQDRSLRKCLDSPMYCLSNRTHREIPKLLM
jgi:hypothetical protein